MIPTVVACSVTVIMALFGFAWVLSGRVSRVEQMIADIPEKMNGKIVEAIRQEQDRCPARQMVAGGTNPRLQVHALPDE
jgi:hypothetical protein